MNFCKKITNSVKSISIQIKVFALYLHSEKIIFSANLRNFVVYMPLLWFCAAHVFALHTHVRIMTLYLLLLPAFLLNVYQQNISSLKLPDKR